MWDWLRSVLGDASGAEIVLVAFWIVCVWIYRQPPKLGEAIGAWLGPKPPVR